MDSGNLYDEKKNSLKLWSKLFRDGTALSGHQRAGLPYCRGPQPANRDFSKDLNVEVSFTGLGAFLVTEINPMSPLARSQLSRLETKVFFFSPSCVKSTTCPRGPHSHL